ncbi:MAG: NADH-quinone oxidoreductase subunit NuoE [Nitrospirae bacterium]|nr:NADH-quinone oxidoreductase subunit NuoE [Nitrospirota bacterium]
MIKTQAPHKWKLSKEGLAEIDRHIAKYPDKRAALMPALKVAEREYGWVSEEAMAEIAGILELTKAEVYGFATYYTMYKLQPTGRHLIQFCDNISCMLCNAEGLLDYLQKKLGIGPGETTHDQRFSMVTMECIGACGTAPAMLVNTDFYDNLTEKKLDEILEKYK